MVFRVYVFAVLWIFFALLMGGRPWRFPVKKIKIDSQLAGVQELAGHSKQLNQ